MAWVTLTDFTINDAWEYTTANNLDIDIQYLKDYNDTYLGNVIILDIYTQQVITDLPRVGLINLLEHNINAIKDAVGTPEGWITLNENWAAITNDTFIYTNANNINTDLNLLKQMLENIVASLRYCGTFRCGESNGMLIVSEGLS